MVYLFGNVRIIFDYSGYNEDRILPYFKNMVESNLMKEQGLQGVML